MFSEGSRFCLGMQDGKGEIAKRSDVEKGVILYIQDVVGIHILPYLRTIRKLLSKCDIIDRQLLN